MAPNLGARSSVGERCLHTAEAAGSIPAAPTGKIARQRLVSLIPVLRTQAGAPATRRAVHPAQVTEEGATASRKAAMPAFSSPHRRSVIVSRLRAAGCVFAEEEARLLISAARTRDDLAIMVDRRAAGLPLEHVLGWAEFCGLRIVVDPGVFVSRRRTEFLVRQAAALARQAVSPASQVLAGSRVVVVDLCCGSGAVGVALVAALDGVELYAVDIDPAAVRWARPTSLPVVRLRT